MAAFQNASDALIVQNRRAFVSLSAFASISQIVKPSFADLSFETSASGIAFADAKVGTGPTPAPGSYVSIDYSLSTTGARYGAKIYSTADKGGPYRWKLGDGTTIAGIEEAILGSDGMPAMRPGGIRRVILPEKRAYTSLGKDTTCEGVGPIPPKDVDTDSFGAFQRFKNIYCNPNRQYQPDVVMDIKLYGPRQ